jgi:hypothetical protein
MKTFQPKEVLIVGCGGVCSYFLPAFLRYLKHNSEYKTNVTLMDGDVLEEKNTLRQNFDLPSGVLPFKTEALKLQCNFYKMKARNIYFAQNEFFEEDTLVFCFVDNHLARKHVLEAIDENGGCAILAANAEIDAHSYIYYPEWNGTNLDPRKRFKEILEDTTGSPIKRAMGCQSEELLDNSPQTSIANQMAASHALLLWNFWFHDFPKFGETPEELFEKFPIEFGNTNSNSFRTTIEQLKK